MNINGKMIKGYQEKDLESVIRLLRIMQMELDPEDYAPRYLDIDYYKNHWLKNSQYITFIDKREVFQDRTTGFIIMSPRGDITLELDMLYVEPKYRHQWIAKDLKAECEEWGKLHRYLYICSKVGKTNYPSIRLNEQCGWKIFSEKDSYYLFYKMLKNGQKL